MNAAAAAPISFIALNRIAEQRAVIDPDYRRNLERWGKPLLSHARTSSDEAWLEKLLRVATRHQLLSELDVARLRLELDRLKQQFDEAAGG